MIDPEQTYIPIEIVHLEHYTFEEETYSSYSARAKIYGDNGTLFHIETPLSYTDEDPDLASLQVLTLMEEHLEHLGLTGPSNRAKTVDVTTLGSHGQDFCFQAHSPEIRGLREHRHARALEREQQRASKTA